MVQTAKFMFDRSFEAPSRGRPGDRTREEWERKVAEARQAGYEQGRADGEAAAKDSLEAETRETVDTLIDSAGTVLEAVDAECAGIRRQSAELALTAANCLAADLVNRMPATTLEAMFAEALDYIGEAPHVALTVNEKLADIVQEKVSALAAKRGFEGRIVVLGDPDTRTGNCHVQWADGGITLDMESTTRSIMRIVRRHLDGRDNAAPSPSPAAANGSGAKGSGANGHGDAHDEHDANGREDTQSAHSNGSGDAP